MTKRIRFHAIMISDVESSNQAISSDVENCKLCVLSSVARLKIFAQAKE